MHAVMFCSSFKIAFIKSLLKWLFKKFARTLVQHPGTVFAAIAVVCRLLTRTQCHFHEQLESMFPDKLPSCILYLISKRRVNIYSLVMMYLPQMRISSIPCTIVKCLFQCSYFKQLRSYSWKDGVEAKFCLYCCQGLLRRPFQLHVNILIQFFL